jgi:hypothetical protein
MSISVVVHGEVLQDEDEEDLEEEEGSAVLEKEFTTVALVSCMRNLLKSLKKNKVEELSVFKEDHLIALMDSGGELDHDDSLALLEDMEVIAEHFPELSFQDDDERQDIEIFIDELGEVLQVCGDAEGSLEFFNNEESVDAAAEAREEEEEEEEQEELESDELDEEDEEEEFFDDDDELGLNMERPAAENFIKDILKGAFGNPESETKDK